MAEKKHQPITKPPKWKLSPFDRVLAAFQAYCNAETDAEYMAAKARIRRAAVALDLGARRRK